MILNFTVRSKAAKIKESSLMYRTVQKNMRKKLKQQGNRRWQASPPVPRSGELNQNTSCMTSTGAATW